MRIQISAGDIRLHHRLCVGNGDLTDVMAIRRSADGHTVDVTVEASNGEAKYVLPSNVMLDVEVDA